MGNEIYLNPKEYGKICAEISTNYNKYSNKFICVHLSYGTDNRSYAYYFENHGFSKYVFLKRVLLDD